MANNIVSVVQGMVAKHETGGTVNPKYLSRKIESLKDHYRTMKSAYGEGEKTRFGYTLAELRALRDRAIQVRNAYGERPPAAPAPAPEPTYQPQRMYIDGIEVRGVVRDPQGNIRQIIPREQRHPRYVGGYTEHERYLQPRGDSYERQAKKVPKGVKEAGSFVDTINQGRQVLIVEETPGGYFIRPNPNIDLPASMERHIEKNLRSRGFVKEGDGWVYRKEVRDTSINEPFDFTKPFYKTKTGEVFGELPDLPFDFSKDGGWMGYGKPSRSRVLSRKPIPPVSEDILSSPEIQRRLKEGKEEDLSNFLFFADTGVRDFYKTDYTERYLVNPLRGFETEHGLYLQDTPVGEVRGSDVFGFFAHIPEDVIKSIGAIGTVGRGVYEAQRYGKGEATKEEYLMAAGGAYAAYPSFLKLPETGIIVTAMALSGTTTTTKAVGNVGGKQASLISRKVVMEGGSSKVIEEFAFRTGGGYQLEILKPGIGKLAQAMADPIMKAAGGMAGSAPARIAGSAIKTGAMFGGIQTAVEVVPRTMEAWSVYDTSMERPRRAMPREMMAIEQGVMRVLEDPAALGRIRTAALAGGVLGAGLETYGQAKPFFESKGAQYKEAAHRIAGAPGGFLKGSVDLAFDAFQSQKTLYFLAGSPKSSLRQFNPENPLFIPASLTAAGLNPYELIKPRTRTRQMEAQASQILPLVLDVSPGESKFTQLYQRALTRTKKGRELKTVPVIIPGLSELNVTSKASRRQEMIREDILQDVLQREAGRTKAEQIEALRLGERIGLGLRLGERLWAGQKYRTRLSPIIGWGEREFPRTLIGARPRTRQGQRGRGRETPPRSPPIIPRIDLGFPDSGRKRKDGKRRKTASKTEYAPSLFGIFMGKEEKRLQKIYSGFEIRGLRPSKKKKK